MKKLDDIEMQLTKANVVTQVFADAQKQMHRATSQEKGLAFAPTNIALCKYWGKRNQELNLPVTSSLSITLPDKGAMTTVSRHDEAYDRIILNGNEIAADSHFLQRTAAYLDLFRPEKNWHLSIEIKMDIPVAAGLASSACGFASLTSALNDLFAWNLQPRELSLLARLGSGSACRSFWPGFVEWQAGVRPDGMDSFGKPLDAEWPSLCIGILPISSQEKPVSSREAMQRTVNSSTLYSAWPKKAAQDLGMIKQAIQIRNFSLLAGTAESNALAMHATIMSSWPPLCYFLPETITAMQHVWKLRHDGLAVYFTQDAGPNLKLLFQEKDVNTVKREFPQVEVARVF